jgi:hypothetical protein
MSMSSGGFSELSADHEDVSGLPEPDEADVTELSSAPQHGFGPKTTFTKRGLSKCPRIALQCLFFAIDPISHSYVDTATI